MVSPVSKRPPVSSLLVRDLMSVGVPTCPSHLPVEEVARLLLEKNLEEVVVLEEGHAVGVVGAVELARAFASGKEAELRAEEVMREDLPKLPADLPLLTAAQIMLDQGVRVVYMTHHAGGIEYPAGYLSLRHILRYLAARSQEELKDLGIEARRELPLQAFFKRREAARRQRLQTADKSKLSIRKE